MQAQIKDIRKKFLDEFTLEIILNLLQIRIDIIKQKEEEERVRRVVEAEKLKLKFKQYAEEKELAEELFSG